MLHHRDLTDRIIGLAIEVHRTGGPVLLEIKAVTALLATHDAQILTYLRMSQIRIGLLLNFHAIRLRDGLRRIIV